MDLKLYEDRCRIFLSLGVKSWVRKLLVEVGAPNDCPAPLLAALMTRSFRFLRFMRAVHSSLERLESLVLQLDFSL